MSIKITIPNTSSDYLTFGSGNTPTAAQIAGIDSGSSNGQLAIYTTASGTSTERVRVDSSGNLLVGLTSAITSWGSGAKQQLQITANGARYPGISSYSFSTTAAGDGAMINLGRSRSATVGTMTVTQSGDALGYLIFEGVNSSGSLAGGGWISTIQTAAAGASYIPAAMTFNTSDATNGVLERMRIASNGNVGIGGTPSADTTYKWLNIVGPSTSGGGLVQLNNSDSSVGINMFCTNLAGYMGTSTAHPLLFRINSSEVARIDSSGNLLVGTTSSTGRIGSKAATTDNTGYGIYVEDSASATMFYARNDGVISTGAKSASPYNNTTASAANMFVSSAGVLQRSTSSLKYKTNVQDATHGLTELLTLRPVTYEGKAESDVGKTFGGLIAEEVHEAGLTEFVQYAEDGSPDALAYGNMVSLCIKAIQEQQALIQTLTDRITALEGK